MKDAIKELFPPDDHGRPLSPLTRWRIAVFAVCVGFLCFMGWALSPYGFALAQDVQTIRTNVDDMRLSQIEQQVYDAKQSECTAIVADDSQARRFFSSRVMELARKYRALARGEIIIPPCTGGQQP